MAVKKDEPNNDSFMYDSYEPELFWRLIPIDELRDYYILLFDINKHELREMGGGNWYIIYKVKLLKGFQGLPLDLGSTFLMHFPLRAFRLAWRQGKGYRQVDKDEQVDCLIRFKRPTKKSIDIYDRKFLPVAKYNSEEEIKKFVEGGSEDETFHKI